MINITLKINCFLGRCEHDYSNESNCIIRPFKIPALG